MFKRNKDSLNERNIELARMLRDALNENRELKAKRKLDEKNNMLILKVNTQQSKLIEEIQKVLKINDYGNKEVKLGKINELVHTFNKTKLTQINKI